MKQKIAQKLKIRERDNHKSETGPQDYNKIEIPKRKGQQSIVSIRHKCGGTTHLQNTEQVINTGNCSAKFQFRLIGLERINLIFNEIKEQIATFNKSTEPKNVTLHKSSL